MKMINLRLANILRVEISFVKSRRTTKYIVVRVCWPDPGIIPMMSSVSGPCISYEITV